MMPLTAEDLVIGILYRIKKDKKELVSADREVLHRAFFNAQQKFPTVMSVFAFRKREQFPESEQLDQALSNLDASGIISRQNLTPRYYRFEKALESSYTKFSKSILSGSGIDETALNNAADEIEKEIAIQQ